MIFILALDYIIKEYMYKYKIKKILIFKIKNYIQKGETIMSSWMSM